MTAQERTRWRGVFSEEVNTFDEKRTTNFKDRRMKRKAESAFAATTVLTFEHKVQPSPSAARGSGSYHTKEVIDHRILVRRHRCVTQSSTTLTLLLLLVLVISILLIILAILY